jgi:hypothetical protein
LNKVDLPTLGSPTIPHLSAIISYLLIVKYPNHQSGRKFTPTFSFSYDYFSFLAKVFLFLIINCSHMPYHCLLKRAYENPDDGLAASSRSVRSITS